MKRGSGTFLPNGLTENSKSLGRILVGLLLLCVVALAGRQTSPPASISGRWEAEGVISGPWVFDLTVSGNTVTGTVRQSGSLLGPAQIYEGKVDGAMVTFKTMSPVTTSAAKEITFRGRTNDSGEISFERSVEVLLAAGPRDDADRNARDVYGTDSTPRFTARRSGPVPVPPITLRTPQAPVDVTGRWESLRWSLDVWTLDLKSNGNQLTGTVGVVPFGAERQELANSRPIYDTRIDGNTVSFKVKSPDNVRTISFSGKAQDDEIFLLRTVELPLGGTVGFDVIFDVYAPMGFAARRVSTSREYTGARELQEAQKKWAGRALKGYEFTAQWRCLCAIPPVPITYRVSGTTGAAQLSLSVVQMSGIASQNVLPIIERYSTIDRIFELLNQAAAKRPFSLRVEYGPEFGYPLFVDLRPVGIAVDDDLQLRITGFRVLN